MSVVIDEVETNIESESAQAENTPEAPSGENKPEKSCSCFKKMEQRKKRLMAD
ncbi:MAG: hypothetical protein OEX07_05670 [Gammaproteobacteria bacterium]|nr:hypothetical protein [Gammaproteobacteria bacterium]